MLNVGILGCGVISNIHELAIKDLPNVRLYGVSDWDVSRAKAFAEGKDIVAYESFEDMLKDENIDAVSICTPSGLHAEQAVKALNAGKHVLIEKPLALTTEQCDMIRKAQAESGKVVSVVSQMRYAEDVIRVKRAIENGEFGKIVSCDLELNYYRAPEYYSASPWRGTIKMDGGGALMNQGIHGVDLLEYFFGKYEVMASKIDTRIHKIEAEDSAVALVSFSCGAVGIIQASTATAPGLLMKTKIYGDRGYAVLTDDELTEMVIDGKEIVYKNIKPFGGRAGDNKALNYANHSKQYENFVNAIEGKEKLLSDINNGIDAVEIITTVYKKSL